MTNQVDRANYYLVMRVVLIFSNNLIFQLKPNSFIFHVQNVFARNY